MYLCEILTVTIIARNEVEIYICNVPKTWLLFLGVFYRTPFPRTIGMALGFPGERWSATFIIPVDRLPVHVNFRTASLLIRLGGRVLLGQESQKSNRNLIPLLRYKRDFQIANHHLGLCY